MSDKMYGGTNASISQGGLKGSGGGNGVSMDSASTPNQVKPPATKGNNKMGQKEYGARDKSGILGALGRRGGNEFPSNDNRAL